MQAGGVIAELFSLAGSDGLQHMVARIRLDLRFPDHPHIAHRFDGFFSGHHTIDLRILEFAPRAPLLEMKRFLPVMWVSFWISVVTGINLVVPIPPRPSRTRFSMKLTLISISLFMVRLIAKDVMSDPQLDVGPVPRNARVWRRSPSYAGAGNLGGPGAAVYLRSPVCRGWEVTT